MTLFFTVEERPGPLGPTAPVKAYQNVIVTIKDWNGRRSHRAIL
jgi:hypothetical protein